MADTEISGCFCRYRFSFSEKAGFGPKRVPAESSSRTDAEQKIRMMSFFFHKQFLLLKPEIQKRVVGAADKKSDGAEEDKQ